MQLGWANAGGVSDMKKQYKYSWFSLLLHYFHLYNDCLSYKMACDILYSHVAEKDYWAVFDGYNFNMSSRFQEVDHYVTIASFWHIRRWCCEGVAHHA